MAFACADIAIPVSTEGKNQLEPFHVERTLASVRIHVESYWKVILRVIGNIRQKYAIFSSAITTTYLISEGDQIMSLQKIVNVCSALVNTCPAVVPYK